MTSNIPNAIWLSLTVRFPVPILPFCFMTMQIPTPKKMETVHSSETLVSHKPVYHLYHCENLKSQFCYTSHNGIADSNYSLISFIWNMKISHCFRDEIWSYESTKWLYFFFFWYTHRPLNIYSLSMDVKES